MKNDPIETALARLDEVALHTPEGQKQLAKALASKWNLVVKKAATVIGEAQWTELADELAAAFERLLHAGTAADKGCAAKIAIARALNKLEYDSADLYLAGMEHVQREGSWGPPVDTAAELRAVCAMGLAGSTYYFKLRKLVDLLADREWLARAGAVRAIAAVGSEAAALLLRLKALAGDKETEVLSDCFAGLIAVDGAEGVSLVATFTDSKREEVQEAAILSLGASRRIDAVESLRELFARTADTKVRSCILLSLATSRMEPAIEFLLNLIREETPQAAALAVSALAVYRDDPKIRAEVAKAAQSRSDGTVLEITIA